MNFKLKLFIYSILIPFSCLSLSANTDYPNEIKMGLIDGYYLNLISPFETSDGDVYYFLDADNNGYPFSGWVSGILVDDSVHYDWLDALIKEKQFENAKQVFEQAKIQGVAEEKLNVLEAQLASLNKQETVGSLSPSQEQLSSLLEYYQNGRFDGAEKLAVSITNEFPKHQFGWKVLGAVLGATGRKSEAVDANQTRRSLIQAHIHRCLVSSKP